ncbi:DNA adenine methylase, partial [Pseudomonas aeruginosa]|nr:DNA adenine methylase [Pseudomonas aeruginosa]
MPPHQTYIESHLGGGAVMRNKKAAQRNIGLDLDAKVIELWESKLPGTCE